MKKVSFAIVVFECISIFALLFNAYRFNQHGHTGINLFWLIGLFSLLFLSSLLLERKRLGVFLSKNSLLSGLNLITCSMLIILLKELDILQSKTEWIHAGMPPQPGWKDFFLVTYFIAYITILVLLWSLQTKEADVK